jgi:acyl-homoserine lactone acylase PvdQ
MSKILIFLFLLVSAVIYTKYLYNYEKVKIESGTGHAFEIYRDNKGIPHIFSHNI